MARKLPHAPHSPARPSRSEGAPRPRRRAPDARSGSASPLRGSCDPVVRVGRRGGASLWGGCGCRRSWWSWPYCATRDPSYDKWSGLPCQAYAASSTGGANGGGRVGTHPHPPPTSPAWRGAHTRGELCAPPPSPCALGCAEGAQPPTTSVLVHHHRFCGERSCSWLAGATGRTCTTRAHAGNALHPPTSAAASRWHSSAQGRSPTAPRLEGAPARVCV